MAAKTNMEMYNDIFKKYPEIFKKIQKEISYELEYDFLHYSLIKDGGLKCVDYAKIIPKIKYPEGSIKDKLERAKANEVNEPSAFLIAGTVIHIEKDDKGRHKIIITDDERLWNNPDDYDWLVHVSSARNVKHCIIANEFFNREHDDYSIGNIENLRLGARVMMSVFYLETTSNPLWLKAAFTDIEFCSRELSDSSEYYKVKLDKQFKMITRDEFFERFFALARQSGVMDLQNADSNDNSSGGCYIATCVYGSYDCPQVWTLRRYRDCSLSKTWYGRFFVYVYYVISPTLVKWFGHTKWFKGMWRDILDRIVKRLQNSGVESTPYEDKK